MVHDFRALAVMLVKAGCEHICEQVRKRPGNAGKKLLDAALTAQGNLVVLPEYQFTSQDFAALTNELEQFAREQDNACPDVEIGNPPSPDDGNEHLKALRNALRKTLELAAGTCPQPTLEKVAQLLAKAWEIVNVDEAAVLSRFRTALVKAYVAEFKHAHAQHHSRLN
ncbi:MAG: hypothetical protein BroJett014_11250 [Planctomycetota bacterium]|nr:hypothetical protein [Planctomycetota bacterium]GIK52152.1 MAG: hypothetical protein BroJett014_11250 [Planctomycetota bacterium]